MPGSMLLLTIRFSWQVGRTSCQGRRLFPMSLNPFLSPPMPVFCIFPWCTSLLRRTHFSVVSDLDCTHSPIAWQRVNSAFSPHTLDLMAIPCNIKCDRSGHPLRFFSTYPCPKAAGTNVFAQNIPLDENAFVFLPFVFIGPLVKFLSSQGYPFSIVLPDLHPHKFWWPLVERSASSPFKLGSKGDPSILLFPTRSSPSVWSPHHLQWNIWVFRIPGA